MRDFPVFSTEHGVGSLVLKEIPYSGIAYITIRDTLEPEAFLTDCIGFCKAVGADKIYASGHVHLQKYPFYTSVVRMCAEMEALGETDALIFPVTEKTLEQWRKIYNEKMTGIANASYMSIGASEELLKKGGAYFVHRDGMLLGIGSVADDRIESVVSVMPGSGRDVVLALKHALFCDQVQLEVASTNGRAIRLYENLGFIKTAEISKWYKIL